MPLELNEILKIALKGGASDIHLKSGLPPIFRVDGALVPLKNAERLLPEQMDQIAEHVMNPVQTQRFDRKTRIGSGLRDRGTRVVFASTCFSSAEPRELFSGSFPSA